MRFRLVIAAWIIAAISFVCVGRAGELKVFYPATHTGWVLQTPSGKVYVIDPGVSPEFYSTKAGTGIGTYLKKQAIRTIDGVVISHPHPDHYNAGVELFRDFRVLELIDAGFNPKNNNHGGYNSEFWTVFQASHSRHTTSLRAGAVLNWDAELTVKVCGPKQPFWTYAEAGNDPERYYNQNSLVLWVKHGPVSYFFTGDITAPAMNFLRLNYAAEVRDTAVVSIPHHGKYYFHEDFARLLGADHPSVRLGIASKSHTKKGVAADKVPTWRKSGLTVYTGDGNNDVTVVSNGGDEFVLQTSNPMANRTYKIVNASPGTRSTK